MEGHAHGGQPALRNADNTDIAAVRTIVMGVLAEYGLAPDPDGIDRDLDDLEAAYVARGGCFQVLEVDGAVIGCYGLYPLRDGVAELRKMYLLPAWRGRGLGRMMLEQALATARQLGCRRIELETNSCLKEAVALYRRYGFEPFEACHGAARCDQGMALNLV